MHPSPIRRRDLRHTRQWAAAVICAVLTWLPARVARADDYLALGDEIVAHVRDQFLDAKRAQAWAEKHARYGAVAKDAADFERLTNAALAKLSASHKERVWPASWRKPVVLVTNRNTRSGKEIVAFEFRKHAIGPVVGERTAGAVLMGRPISLSDGSLLYLAVERCEIDGVVLEGSGVAPSIEVADNLFYAAGADPQRERAVTLAAELAAKYN